MKENKLVIEDKDKSVEFYAPNFERSQQMQIEVVHYGERWCDTWLNLEQIKEAHAFLEQLLNKVK